MLSATQLSYAIRGRALLTDASLRIAAGELHVLCGPNGAGKSTLLRLCAGELRPSAGAVDFAGRPMADWSYAELARRRAVLPQHSELSFDFSAAEIVALGMSAQPSAPPQRAIQALEATGSAALSQRRYSELSGGERARVQLARVLAQVWDTVEGHASEPQMLLLDEPTAHLDLAYQHLCLRLARRFTEAGGAVLAVLHDPNLALRYADRASLMHQGRVIASGLPDEVLSAEALSEIYGLRMRRLEGAVPPVLIAGD